jgi:hypothetical protein
MEHDDEGYEVLEAALNARPRKVGPPTRMGRGWDFDNERLMRKRFPRLWALYNTAGDNE